MSESKKSDILIAHVYYEDLFGQKPENALGLVADHVCMNTFDAVQNLLQGDIETFKTWCRPGKNGLGVRLSVEVFPQPDTEADMMQPGVTQRYAVIPDPE